VNLLGGEGIWNNSATKEVPLEGGAMATIGLGTILPSLCETRLN
jgi:hypothetical protein